MTPPTQRPEDRFVIRVLRAVNLLIARGYHRSKVLAPPQLPLTGPAILVSNHTSGLDPLLIQAPCQRLITWMMAAEYFEIKLLAPFFRTLGVIPVQRTGRDAASLRAALRALKNGQVLGIFPEGRIETSHELLPFQTGVAMIAIHANVPVYPVFLEGSQRGKEMVRAFLTRNRVMLRFGPAVEFDRSSTSREALEAATDRIRNAVASLQI